MKERPINLRADEVRAILAGRKTQFRRVIKPQPDFVTGYYNPGQIRTAYSGGSFDPTIIPRPFGAPGDRLWVRETFRLYDCQTECACYDSCSCSSHHGKPVFRATHPDDEGPWIPSVHMPRKFSRITLEVVSGLVERLQDISEEDAIAEGYDSQSIMENPDAGRLWFRHMWQFINGPRSWEANPWIRAVEFRVIEGGAA